ncbi:hypothetical protein PTKIN_Ptkin16aG0502200 [Pterospermum kingtungense]
MELQHFHKHPLTANHENDENAYCSGCGEEVSAPYFSCMECGFHLDQNCAKAPPEMNHPFHRKHCLKLQAISPSDEGEYFCDLCVEDCENFVYQCSCDLFLHIKCALFSYNMAEKRIGDQLRHITYPSISSENHPEELKKAECFVCCKPLLGSAYIDCDFFLHKKCALLPLETKHSFHLQHPLFLQFNTKFPPCNICQETQTGGLVYWCSSCNLALHIECPKMPHQINHPCHPKHLFIRKKNDQSLRCQSCRQTSPSHQYVYCCSICEFAFHAECISPPPVIKNKGHIHPFTLCWRQLPFICNACGTWGNCISYICVMCGFMVHKNCISLPPFLDLPRHDHRLHLNYFLEEEKIKMKKCRICFVEVNTHYGSYSCPSCNYICHVNCATEDYSWYKRDLSKKPTGLDPSYDVISDTEIKHFSHQHNLVLCDDNVDGKLCDGCILFISAPYYHCSKCDFSLHKSCAELPRKKKLWFHRHQTPFTLFSGSVFRCGVCEFECSGFAYKCGYFNCGIYSCLRCAAVHSHTSKGHQHQLWFLDGKEAECNACGVKSRVEYWCNNCNFAVHDKCLKLPQIARHKCDEHPLKLTYHDDNDYVKHHYCDICEEQRDPSHWFYCCKICDKSAHPECVLGKYPFIKPGSSYNGKYDHPHRPLIFVQKVYDYPECHICGKRCVDLALECAETGCKYTVHWECIKPSKLLG